MMESLIRTMMLEDHIASSVGSDDVGVPNTDVQMLDVDVQDLGVEAHAKVEDEFDGSSYDCVSEGLRSILSIYHPKSDVSFFLPWIAVPERNG